MKMDDTQYNGNGKIPENKTLAVGRLKSLVKMMKGNPDLIMKYDSIIEDHLGQGSLKR